MGMKINLSKLAGTPPVVELPVQKAPNRSLGLYLLALRSKAAHRPQIPGSEKQVIPVEPDKLGTAPETVQISHA